MFVGLARRDKVKLVSTQPLTHPMGSTNKLPNYSNLFAGSKIEESLRSHTDSPHGRLKVLNIPTSQEQGARYFKSERKSLGI